MSSDWDNLRVFLAVAEEGTLTAAARRLKVSHPTIARRLKALEEELGARLFERLPDGYQPTDQAIGLLEEARLMGAAAQALERRAAGLGDTHLGTVRIAVDETLADFLSRKIGALARAHSCIEFEIAVTHLSANLSRREADLMIRPQVPDLANLVQRKLATVEYALYATAQLAARWDGSEAGLRGLPWVGFDEDHRYMPGQDWQQSFLGEQKPQLRTNNGLVLARAICGGSGVGILPCFFGDSEPGLTRLLPPLEAARTQQWLLVHPDLRRVRRVRIVIDALAALFAQERALLEGRSREPLALVKTG
ncbi:MAG: LysR family transcriptional regulator [Pseudomonadota bacterium]